MPTYVYECSACEKTFEKDQRISEEPLSSCECGNEGSVKRIMQPTAVMFKGSGFHINDYSGTNAAAEPAKESKSESKSESKPSGGCCGGSCGCAS